MATPKKQSKSAKAEKSADKPAHVAPVVNLTQAAQSAAMLLAARSKRQAAEGDTTPVNAAAFRKLKDTLGQPQHAATSPLAGLNKPSKPTGTAGYNRVGGHHQTSGANVARTGVPRRTSGG